MRANDFRAPPPAPEDTPELDAMPPELRRILKAANGWLWLRGGFHVRGACRALPAHSLARVWTGELALARLFTSVEPGDVPFAQDAFGDQYLLRDGTVHRLLAEEDRVESMDLALGPFFTRVRAEGAQLLGLGRFLETCDAEGDLFPGQLVSVSPPFVMKSERYSLRRISADERLRFLSHLARRLRGLPEGERVKFTVE